MIITPYKDNQKIIDQLSADDKHRIDSWIKLIPDANKRTELLANIRSKDQDQVKGAYAELISYQVFSSMPNTQFCTGQGVPDIEFTHGNKVYVEVTKLEDPGMRQSKPGVGFCDRTKQQVKDKVSSKLKQHRGIKGDIIICLCDTGVFEEMNDSTMMDAILGDDSILLKIDKKTGNVVSQTPFRHRNGIWNKPYSVRSKNDLVGIVRIMPSFPHRHPRIIDIMLNPHLPVPSWIGHWRFDVCRWDMQNNGAFIRTSGSLDPNKLY